MTHAEAKPPLSAGDVSAVTADTQELRLATTMTGGVSLAVWMGGVAREIDLLMQASKTRRQLQRTPGASQPTPAAGQRRGTLSAADEAERVLYTKLIELLDVVVEVDVLSGTSAGGVNAAMLAFARANDGDLGGLRNLWLDLGALLDLLREPTDKDAPSLLYGDQWMFRQLKEALPGLGSQTPPQVPPSTTLYITTTLLTGESGRFTDAMGTLVQDTNQRGLFTFTETDLVSPEFAGAVALAGRSTASFPGAFEPSFIPFQESTAAQGKVPVRPAMGKYANITRNHWVVDGGVLNNQPLDVLLERIFDRRARRPVRRVLLFVVPSAGPAPDLIAAAPADDLAKPYGLLEGLLKVVSAATGQSISASLRAIVAHNDRIGSRTDLRVQLADMANRILPGRLLTAGLLEDYRARESERQARKLVTATMQLLSTWPPQTAPDSVGIPAEWEPLLGTGGNAEQVCRAQIRGVLHDQWRAPDANGIPSPSALPATSVVLSVFGQSPYDNAKSMALTVVRLAYLAATAPAERQAFSDLNAKIHGAMGRPDRPEPADLVENIYQAVVKKGIKPGSGDSSFRTAAQLLARTWADGTSVDPDAWDMLGAALKSESVLFSSVATNAAATELSTYLDYLRLDSDETLIAVRLFDLAAAEDALIPVEAGHFQPVELVQVSADTRGLLTPSRTTAGRKLTGLQFHNFGAFYKKSWRANDWMWGRLDGAGWLVHALLDPRRLLAVAGRQTTSGRASWLLAELETFGAVPLSDASTGSDGVPTRTEILAELAFLDGTVPVPKSTPRTSMWLATAWQRGIAQDELPKLARVITGQQEGTPPGGKNPPGQQVDRSPSGTLTWASKVLEQGADIDVLLNECPVADEKFETDMGSPLMVRTVAKAAATGAAAVSSVSQVPGPVRPAVTTAHTIALGGYRVANIAKAVPRNLIIVGLVLLALGIAAASQSADLFGVAGLVVAAVGGYLVTFGTWQLNRGLFTALVASTVTFAVVSLAFPPVRSFLFGTPADPGWVSRNVYWLGTEWWHPLLAVFLLTLLVSLAGLAYSRVRPKWMGGQGN